MHVLITGGAGFIGGHLTEKLLRAGHAVTAVDNLATGSRRNIEQFLSNRNYRFVCDNIRHCEFLPLLVREADCIVHLAAAVGVRLIVEKPVDAIETNIHGTEVILALANKLGRKILIASTSEVYGKSEKIPFNEDDDTVIGLTRYGRWSYACSKAIDEFLAFAYHQEHGLPVIVVRLFNTVGPRQTGRYGMVLPRFVQAALEGRPLEVHGTGKQTRCFCDVSDVTDALAALLTEPKAVGECFNVGNDREISIADTADLVIRQLGSKSVKKLIPYEEAFGRPFEDMMRRVPDISKIRRTIGYSPKITLEETIQRIADHIRRSEGAGN
jgi:UDP-glucose 4-epimerase